MEAPIFNPELSVVSGQNQFSPPAESQRIFVARCDSDLVPAVLGFVTSKRYFDGENDDEPIDLEIPHFQTNHVSGA